MAEAPANSAAATAPVADPSTATAPGAVADVPTTDPESTGAATVEGVEADPNILEVDDNDDSAVGLDADSTRSQSITSSITGYKYENGRRYHAYREGAYFLPNDDKEQARLDLVHHVFRISLDGSLFFAPISSGIKRALDIGTGTGIWAIDFAEEFPDTEVIGTDLSPIQPTWVPSNLNFYVDDLEDGWNYPAEEQFDYIHERSLGGSVADWPRLVRHIFESLKPGGWAEFQEYQGAFFSDTDPKLDKSPALRDWIENLVKASSVFGKELDVSVKLNGLLQDAGFVDIKTKIIHVPSGPWAKGKKAKEMGAFQREQMCDAVDAFTPMLFTRVLGWTLEECLEMQTKVKEVFRSNTHQAHAKTYKCNSEIKLLLEIFLGILARFATETVLRRLGGQAQAAHVPIVPAFSQPKHVVNSN